MARLLTAGAEELDITSLWDDLNTADRFYAYVYPYYSPYLRGVLPRTGWACYMLMQASSEYLGKSLSNLTEVYMGFALRHTGVDNSQNFLEFNTDNGIGFQDGLTLRHITGGIVRATRWGTTLADSSSGVLSTTAWHYVEVYYKPANSGGRVTVRVDGTQVIDYTGDTTNDLEYIKGVRISGNCNNTTTPAFYDDIVINDTSGSANNSWPGQVRLLPITPLAPTTMQWTRVAHTTGPLTHGGGEPPYVVQTTATGNKVRGDVLVPDLPSNATIQNIIVNARAKVGSGSGSIKLLCYDGTTEGASASQPLGANWQTHQGVWSAKPSSGAWAESDLANLEMGFESA